MNTTLRIRRIFALMVLSSVSLTAQSQDGAGQDPFTGRLFPPNIILERESDLDLSDSQKQEIRQIVISTQTVISEYQWDMREAYQDVMSELDKPTIDESVITEMIQVVLETENQVKLTQIAMLIRLRNLLTQEQLASLRESSQ